MALQGKNFERESTFQTPNRRTDSMTIRNGTHVISGLWSVLFAFLLVACSSDAPVSPPLAQFEPQIANTPDNFQFQVTAATNVSATVEYAWLNSGSRASIDQSCSISSGSAVVTLLDSNLVPLYSSLLSANGTFQSDTGQAGTWRVRVVLTNLSGTLNFRTQKL